ncbi:MAG: DUF2905 domain-containing protein [Acetobacteraceae bacterium]|nr:DUF2905 domain-containing protein [Acetobacteraceae bacterium]
MRTLLIAAGIVLLLAGLLWPWLTRLPFGTLPSDIRIDRPGFRLYAPLGTCLLISIVLTLIAWLWRG